MLEIIDFICLLSVIIIMYLVNNMSAKPKKNIILGTMLPYDKLTDKNVLKICKEYKKANLYSSILFCLIALPGLLIKSTALNMLFLVLIVFFIMYLSGLVLKKYMTNLRILKSDNDWFATEKHVSKSNKYTDHIIYTDDDEYWGPFFYNNPHDKRSMVDKRIGIGTTINMASKSGKIFTAASAIIFLVTIIPVCILLFSLDNANIKLENKDNSFYISASIYDIDFNKDDIEEIQLVDSLPAKGTKTNGAATDEINLGHFNVDGYGKCMVFMKKNINSDIIVIKLKDKFKDNYIFLTGDSKEETNEFYDKLIS